MTRLRRLLSQTLGLVCALLLGGLLLGGLLLGGSGCAPDWAVFELQIDILPDDVLPGEIPPDGEESFRGYEYAFLQVRRPEQGPLHAPWPAGELDQPGVELDISVPFNQLSIYAEREGPLHARMSFCHTPRCDSTADVDPPTWTMVFDRPLYLGRTTEFAWFVDIAIARPTYELNEDIEACRIRGCGDGVTLDGETDPVWFCDSSGRHFCETAPR